MTTALRLHSGSLDAATDIYRRGNRTIALMGVSHLSAPAFWEAMNARIAGYENLGYEVQFEGVRPDQSGESLNLDYRLVAELLQLQEQREGLTYRKHWVNTDVTLSELLRRNPALTAALQKFATAAASLQHLKQEHPEQFERARAIMRIMTPYGIAAGRFLPSPSGLTKGALVDYRNAVALQGLLGTSKNVVSIWGAGHLPGIGAGLKREGFHRESRVWTTSIPKSTLPDGRDGSILSLLAAAVTA